MNPLAHLLESTLFAGAVWLATLALRRNRARIRHVLWMAASLKFLLPFALLVSLGSHAARRDSASVPPPQMRFVLADAVPPMPLSAPTHRALPAQSDWLPPILWAVWLGGCIAILTRWYVRWRRAARELRGAEPWRGSQLAGPVVASASLAEPGVFGIFHQVLVREYGHGAPITVFCKTQ
jgi:hypothetical protein